MTRNGKPATSAIIDADAADVGAVGVAAVRTPTASKADRACWCPIQNMLRVRRACDLEALNWPRTILDRAVLKDVRVSAEIQEDLRVPDASKLRRTGRSASEASLRTDLELAKQDNHACAKRSTASRKPSVNSWAISSRLYQLHRSADRSTN